MISIHRAKNGGVHLHFGDGTASYADAVLGADGVQGYTRGYVNDGGPATHAGWSCRALVSVQEVKNFLGGGLNTVKREYTSTGIGGLLMVDVLDDGKTAYCTVSIPVRDAQNIHESSKILDTVSREKTFGTWKDSGINHGLISVSLLSSKKGFSN